jgi:hypothetical protein
MVLCVSGAEHVVRVVHVCAHSNQQYVGSMAALSERRRAQCVTHVCCVEFDGSDSRMQQEWHSSTLICTQCQATCNGHLTSTACLCVCTPATTACRRSSCLLLELFAAAMGGLQDSLQPHAPRAAAVRALAPSQHSPPDRRSDRRLDSLPPPAGLRPAPYQGPLSKFLPLVLLVRLKPPAPSALMSCVSRNFLSCAKGVGGVHRVTGEQHRTPASPRLRTD